MSVDADEIYRDDATPVTGSLSEGLLTIEYGEQFWDIQVADSTMYHSREYRVGSYGVHVALEPREGRDGEEARGVMVWDAWTSPGAVALNLLAVNPPSNGFWMRTNVPHRKGRPSSHELTPSIALMDYVRGGQIMYFDGFAYYRSVRGDGADEGELRLSAWASDKRDQATPKIAAWFTPGNRRIADAVDHIFQLTAPGALRAKWPRILALESDVLPVL